MFALRLGEISLHMHILVEYCMHVFISENKEMGERVKRTKALSVPAHFNKGYDQLLWVFNRLKI